MKNVPSIERLKIVCEDVDGSWIKVDEFIHFLKSNRSETDTIKTIKAFNLLRSFAKEDSRETANGRLISLLGVMKYACSNYKALDICKKITSEIYARVFHPRLPSVPSETGQALLPVLDLYKEIAQKPLQAAALHAVLSIHSVDEDSLVTLHTEHRDKFNEIEWGRIKFFEHHFHLEQQVREIDQYEDVVFQKWQFWKAMLDIKGGNLSQLCAQTIKSEKDRQRTGTLIHGLQIKGHQLHLPHRLTTTVKEALSLSANEHNLEVACTQCLKAACKREGLHIYLEFTGDTEREARRIASDVRRRVEQKHSDTCHEVRLFEKGTFKHYTKDDRILVFDLMDDVRSGKLRDKTVFVTVTAPQSSTSSDGPDCPSCATLTNEERDCLHWRNIDVCREWTLSVPLRLQMMLQSFLNNRQLGRSTNTENYARTKLFRLYQAFHSLLNVYDRQYIGVLQDVMSDQLAFGYHNTGTVFNVTSHAGITRSLRDSERRLKREANDTDSQYNAYLRYHKIDYVTSVGGLAHEASLQDCHLVMLIDNLVRLTFHSDPARGENRSSQVCTLPITMKGQ